MNKFTKFVAGAIAAVALVMSAPVQAQSTLPYVSRQAFHITTATTTAVQASDAYVVSIVVNVSVAGAGSTITIRNKEGTNKILAQYSGAAVANFSLLLGSKEAAIYSKSGIEIVTSSTAPTCDVFITSYRP